MFWSSFFLNQDRLIESIRHVQSVETSKTDKLDFSAEHEEKMMRELKEEAEKLREENEEIGRASCRERV